MEKRAKKTSMQRATSSREKDEIKVYQRLHLGLAMTFFLKFSGNIRRAVISTIVLSIIFSSTDTSSDMGLGVFYATQGLGYLAIAVIFSDVIPGLVVFAHHFSSEDWKTSTRNEKIIAFCSLTLHPFSLVVTNIIWLLDVGNPQKHRLARMSTLLHGCLEAPIQFLILLCTYSWGILPLPWMRSTVLVDENDNVLYLGQITMISFVFTCVGLVKASSEAFEIRSTNEQLMAMCWAFLHLMFRLLSYVFGIVILGRFWFPAIPILLIVNYAVLLKNDQITSQWASSISTLAVSFFLPTWISRSPENFQIREKEEDDDGNITRCDDKKEPAEEDIESEVIPIENEALDKKKISFWIAIISTPTVFLFNTVVYSTLRFTDFVQSSVWTDNQLEEFYLFILLPLSEFKRN